MAKNKIALVLSGGGSKGAFQVGVLQVLKEAGYTFDAVSGVSVGALNGSMLATDQFDSLVSIWKELTPDKVIKENSLLKIARQYLKYKVGIGKPPVARYDNAPLEKLLRQHLLGKQAQLPFHFGYVILETGKYVSAIIRWSDDHKINDGDIKRVMASSAIPAVYTPSPIGDKLGVDGGVRNISPIADILPHNPDQIVIIPTEPVGAEKEYVESKDIISIGNRAINIMLDEIFNEDIDRFLTINNLVQQAEEEGCVLKKKNGLRYKYIEPLIIAPKKGLGSGLNFENKNVKRLLAAGKDRARKVLEEISAA